MPLLSLPAETLGAILHYALFPAPTAGSFDSDAVAKRGWKKPNIATLKGLALTCKLLHDIVFEQAAAQTISPSHQQMQMLVKRGHQPCVRTLKFVWQRKHDPFNLDFISACSSAERLEIRFWQYEIAPRRTLADSLVGVLQGLANLTELRIDCDRVSPGLQEEYLAIFEQLDLPKLVSLSIAHVSELVDRLSLVGFPALVELKLVGLGADAEKLRNILQQAPATLSCLSLLDVLDMRLLFNSVEAFLPLSLANQLISFKMGSAFRYEVAGLGNLSVFERLRELDLSGLELDAVDAWSLPISIEHLRLRLHCQMELSFFDDPACLPMLQTMTIVAESDIEVEDFPEMEYLEGRGVEVVWQIGHSRVDHALDDSD